MRAVSVMVLAATLAAAGSVPAGQDPADPAAAKARLAEVEKAIAAKERELSDLRAEGDRLRKRLAVAEDPTGKVCRTPKELLAGLPVDAYPKSGPAGRIECARTEKGLKANIADRQVEWKAGVTDVAIEGNDPYSVHIRTDAAYWTLRVECLEFGGPITLGGESCLVVFDNGPYVTYQKCSEAEADALRKLKGTTVTFRAYLGEYSPEILGSKEMLSFEPRVESGLCKRKPQQADRPDGQYIHIQLPILRPSVNGTYPGKDGWEWRKFFRQRAKGKE